MSGRRKHHGKLSEDDRALWERVIENAEPLARLRFNPAPIVASQVKTTSIGSYRPTAFSVGQKSQSPRSTAHLIPSLDEMFASVSPNMDKRNFDRLKKGKLTVDGTLDLHGMTLAEAHPRLNAFVRGAHASGKRLLLVITGKGKSANDHDVLLQKRGVLRHQVPQWLAMAPLAPLVLQVTQATQKHGGGGAYYVYLRRQR